MRAQREDESQPWQAAKLRGTRQQVVTTTAGGRLPYLVIHAEFLMKHFNTTQVLNHRAPWSHRRPKQHLPKHEHVVARQVVNVLRALQQHQLRQDGHSLQVDGEGPDDLAAKVHSTMVSAHCFRSDDRGSGQPLPERSACPGWQRQKADCPAVAAPPSDAQAPCNTPQRESMRWAAGMQAPGTAGPGTGIGKHPARGHKCT